MYYNVWDETKNTKLLPDTTLQSKSTVGVCTNLKWNISADGTIIDFYSNWTCHIVYKSYSQNTYPVVLVPAFFPVRSSTSVPPMQLSPETKKVHISAKYTKWYRSGLAHVLCPDIRMTSIVEFAKKLAIQKRNTATFSYPLCRNHTLDTTCSNLAPPRFWNLTDFVCSPQTWHQSIHFVHLSLNCIEQNAKTGAQTAHH